MSSQPELLDPHEYDGDLERALAMLHNASANGAGRWSTAAALSRSLRDEHRISIHWRTIGAKLDSHRREYVARRKRNGRWEYQILKEGEKLLHGPDQQITLVDPAKAIQAAKGLHELLAGLKGTIRVCDPYIDNNTIEHLDSCPHTAEIRVLTQKVHASGQLTQMVAAAVRTFRGFQVRTPAVKDLHDRYIIDEESMYILGTSLNGFGKKQSFIIRAGRDVRALMMNEFDRRWTGGALFP